MSAILLCSAKGCRVAAEWALRWNNPKLHPPERRKTWLACAQHRDSLSEFLSARGFLREVTPVEAGSGPDPSPDPADASAPAGAPADAMPTDTMPADALGDRPSNRE
ncbi:hypothetical protein [Rugosimonospora africana]|uniref:hypothetical protein n=1 Tax=Rugosimonospora africana TaxID=556532 RepID=UPI001EF32F7F|nr:hypothetical protein [Rugosimonospora africana]